MTKTQFENVKEYLLENLDEVKQIVSELNSWNGCLDNLEVYENDEEFFNTFFEGKPMEAVRACQYGEYNYTDEYVSFNGYGNLVSYDEREYKRELESWIDEIIENMLENINEVSLSSELEEIING